jgi:hypothetical protein
MLFELFEFSEVITKRQFCLASRRGSFNKTPEYLLFLIRNRDTAHLRSAAPTAALVDALSYRNKNVLATSSFLDLSQALLLGVPFLVPKESPGKREASAASKAA